MELEVVQNPILGMGSGGPGEEAGWRVAEGEEE